jgi:ABC-type branched-subunit amino acid transport system substrate-binding protein
MRKIYGALGFLGTANLFRSIASCFLLALLVGCGGYAKKELPKEPETVEIAVLMPMRGKDGKAGREYSQMINAGLSDALGSANIRVTNYDGTDPESIEDAFHKIISKDTKIILGPLYSGLTSLAAQKFKESNIIIISASNDPTVAGDKVFIFGHAPLKQLSRITEYLLSKGQSDFITLLPQGDHSKTIANIISETALRANVRPVRKIFYSRAPESLEVAVKEVCDIVDGLNEREDIEGKPAIYLSDDSQHLNALYDAIKKHRLDKKALIVGDNRINTDYLKEVDITFTGSLHALNTDILDKAKDLGIAHISSMHALSYDLGKITSYYIGDGFVQSRFINTLNSGAVYNGVSGSISFIDNIARRGYDIIRRENTEYTTLDSWEKDGIK